jgi:hypothetical protein
MARSKQDKGRVPEEHTLEFTEDGKAASLWWTEETEEILSSLGHQPRGLRNLTATLGVGNSPISKTFTLSPSPFCAHRQNGLG